jgi:hypothetical protein
VEKVIGIETKPVLMELLDFKEFLISITQPLQVHGNLFIYLHKKNAVEASELLREAELLEEIHSLIKIEHGIQGEDFFDYGFNAGDCTFLYIELLSPFLLTGESTVQLEMCLLQLEEHLAFTTFRENDESVYFVNSHYNDLIKGIVRAYELKVTFLDLDK